MFTYQLKSHTQMTEAELQVLGTWYPPKIIYTGRKREGTGQQVRMLRNKCNTHQRVDT